MSQYEIDRIKEEAAYQRRQLEEKAYQQKNENESTGSKQEPKFNMSNAQAKIITALGIAIMVLVAIW